jgi:hypothetical protein
MRRNLVLVHERDDGPAAPGRRHRAHDLEETGGGSRGLLENQSLDPAGKDAQREHSGKAIPVFYPPGILPIDAANQIRFGVEWLGLPAGPFG